MTGLAAVRRLTYPGDRTAGAVGQVMGPNRLGEMLTVVDAQYDATTDRTRLGLAYGEHDVEAGAS